MIVLLLDFRLAAGYHLEFDAKGNPYYRDVAMFPTYSVYVNGSLVQTYNQSAVSTFIALDENYYPLPSNLP